MRIFPYFLNTSCHSVIHWRLEMRGWRLDRHLILFRAGRALGLVNVADR